MQLAFGKGTSGLINLPASLTVNAQRLHHQPVASPVNEGDSLFYSSNEWRFGPLNPGSGLEGLAVSNNAVDPAETLDIAAGAALLTIGQRGVGRLSTTLTKSINLPWAAGTNQGGTFDGVTFSSFPFTLHVFLIRNSVNGVVDVGFDSDVNAVHRPSGWSARRIASFPLTVGYTVKPFRQFGNYFEFTNLTLALNNSTAAAGTYTQVGDFAPQNIPILIDAILSPGLPADGIVHNFELQSNLKGNVQSMGLLIYQTGFRGHTSSVYYSAYTAFLADVTRVLVPSTNGSIVYSKAGGAYYSASTGTTIQVLGWFDEGIAYGI